MELVRTPPPALTSLQRWLLGITSMAVAVTRIWSRSATLWDWDEALFCLGVREYNVALHHPHPPGFPLYIAAAKLLRFVVQSDFRALQAIVTVSAIALFPLVFWLAWELRFAFRTAYLGALLFVFLPNVWFYGGTAFSDVPGLALLLAACAAVLRGCRDRRWYFAGALLLGLAAAIRPQALMIGCAPALVASWCRVREKRWRDVVMASVVGIVIIALSYGGAALATGVEGYTAANHNLREYVRQVDSFLNPDRQPVLTLFPSFFVREIPGGTPSDVVATLALLAIVISIVRRDARVWLLVAMFLPFNVFGWFMLDTNSISRYAVSYLPMYALLAADALALIPIVQFAVVAALVLRLGWWAVPPLREVRHTASPPVASMQWIRAHVPHTAKVFVHGSMGPWASYMLGGYDATIIGDPSELPQRGIAADEWLVTEGATAAGGGQNFVRDRGRLFDIVRQRYFEVSVAPASAMFRFGRGWYGEESVGTAWWRWMSGRSETLLPPVSGNARLELGFDLPSELVPRRPTITVTLNGARVDQFVVATPSAKKSWIVPARSDRWNELTIEMDKVINPA
ncbi:MAG TPA: glycosyltransferase family 39 protein, partial [Thermoanaerobaculia bacterium]|nr:glycosyltransferase family 39 protein [Thermoanaerobaculia bacterium]